MGMILLNLFCDKMLEVKSKQEQELEVNDSGNKTR